MVSQKLRLAMQGETAAMMQSGMLPMPPGDSLGGSISYDGNSLSQQSLQHRIERSVQQSLGHHAGGSNASADPHDQTHGGWSVSAGGSAARLGSPTPVPNLGFEALLSAEAARLRWAKNGAEEDSSVIGHAGALLGANAEFKPHSMFDDEMASDQSWTMGSKAQDDGSTGTAIKTITLSRP